MSRWIDGPEELVIEEEALPDGRLVTKLGIVRRPGEVSPGLHVVEAVQALARGVGAQIPAGFAEKFAAGLEQLRRIEVTRARIEGSGGRSGE